LCSGACVFWCRCLLSHLPSAICHLSRSTRFAKCWLRGQSTFPRFCSKHLSGNPRHPKPPGPNDRTTEPNRIAR
jgi:hypothetical protein